MRTRLIGLAIAMLAASLFLAVDAALADEIRVMSSGAFKQAYLELVPEFEKASGHKVVTTFVGGVDLMRRMKAGESVDLVILAASSLDDLIQLGKVDPDSRVDVARSGVGVAVRAGAPRPDISSGDALKQALLAAKSIGYSTGASGAHLAALFQRMGIAEELRPKIKQAPPGVPVGNLIVRGEVEIGFQQISELLPVAGIDFLGPLPQEMQQSTVFAGGVHTGAKAPAAARTLVQFLASPASAPVIWKNGMEPG